MMLLTYFLGSRSLARPTAFALSGTQGTRHSDQVQWAFVLHVMLRP